MITLFDKVHQLKAEPNNDLCLEIQETLIRRISYVESRIRSIKHTIRLHKQCLRSANPRLAKQEAAKRKQEIERARGLTDGYQELLVVFKAIGDAVAFTYLSKWDIKPLAYKESPGFISGKKGNRLERKIFRGVFSLGATAIMNDITNCLRYSDLTIVGGIGFMLIEVKSGRKHSTDDRAERQLEAARRIRKYLDTDRTDNLYNRPGPVVRAALRTEEIHHREALNRIVSKAIADGVSYEEVEAGLCYYAATGFDEASLKEVKAKCGEQVLVAYVNFIDNTAYYPFSLSIQNSEALYQFYTGRLNVLVFIDVATIFRICSTIGFSVELLSGEEWALKMTPQVGDEKRVPVDVSRHMFGRIFGEFLSLQWFFHEMTRIAEIDSSLRGMLDDVDTADTTNPGEAEAGRSTRF